MNTVAGGFAEIVPHAPLLSSSDVPGVVHREYVPLGMLLPRAAALVHHGGIGTAAAALEAGVPQLVTPFAHDQFDNAARLCRLGVAASLRRLQAEPIAAALDRLLSSEMVRARCRELAAQVRSDAPIAKAAETLFGYAGEAAA